MQGAIQVLCFTFTFYWIAHGGWAYFEVTFVSPMQHAAGSDFLYSRAVYEFSYLINYLLTVP